jgi:hypothetical protein
MKKRNLPSSLQKILIVVIGISVIVSCSNFPRPQATATSPGTQVSEIQTEAGEITPASLSFQIFSQFWTICKNEEGLAKNLENIDGSLILNTRDGVITFDIGTFKQKPLDVSGNFIKISLTGDAIADSKPDSGSDMELITQFQKLRFSSPLDSSLYGFLENGSMLFTADSNFPREHAAAVFYIVSPDGRTNSRSIDLPEYENNDDIGLTQYIPNLKYIVYPQINVDNSSIALLNTESKKLTTITEWFVTHNRFGPFPTWRPDGKVVTALLTHREQPSPNQNYFNILPDGQVLQLTHLENVVDGDYDLFHTPMWSPNSQYLVIPISLRQQNSKTVMIFDTHTEETVDTCVIWNQPIYLPLAWSPNGRYLAIQANYGNRIIIIDMENETNYELNVEDYSNVELLGWVNWDIP